MALWMTVEQEVFWLAVVLLVCFCVFICNNLQGMEMERHTVPAFLMDKTVHLFSFVILCGWMIGVGRMEWEQRVIAAEETFVKSYVESSASQEDDTEKIVEITGIIDAIGTTEYGIRLVLKDCAVDGTMEIRKLYVYLDDADNMKLGMRIRVKGTVSLLEPDRNPGGFDFRSYCLSKGIGGSVKGKSVKILDSHVLLVQEGLRQVGLLLEEQIEQIATPEDVGILKAILLGEKGDMDQEIYELYQKNGISHVLAISGLHVSVIGMGIWKILRKLGAGYWSAGVAAFSLLFCFGSIAGFGPSVLRAVCMMGISFTAGIFGRTYDLPSAMCVPAVGLLLWNPYVLTQASFQLSFLAVFAIFFPGEYLAKRWKLKGFWKNLWTSISIQLVTTPVILYHSFEFPVFGIVLNLQVVPLMTYVLISGILGVLGSFVWTPLGVCGLGGAHVILAVYRLLCEMVGMIGGAYQILGRPSYKALAVYFVCLFIGTWIGAKKKIGAVLWLVGALWLLPVGTSGLSVTFLDVGQGDGIVLQAGRRTMLVDCGSSQKKQVGEDVLIPYLKSFGIDHVDVAAVTHGDQDHISGVRELLLDETCGISIGCLLMPVTGREDEACVELKELAEARNIPVCFIAEEDFKSEGSQGEDSQDENLQNKNLQERNVAAVLESFLDEGMEIRCLYPDGDVHVTDRNDGSLVLEIRYGLFRMLLTGDIGESGERAMVEAGQIGPVTVLKVAHHGSAYSTSQEFLDMAVPSCVVFSYGEGNRYGHPAGEVVERCEDIGAEIWETAKSGAVQIWTDGERMQVKGWLDR